VAKVGFLPKVTFEAIRHHLISTFPLARYLRHF
jgi:hypothetical protein